MQRRPTPVCKCFLLCRQIFIDPERQEYTLVSPVHQVFSARYPLVADPQVTLPFFFGALPLLIALAWWASRQPPRRVFAFTRETTNDHP